MMAAPRAIAIGASAGGVQALAELLPALPADAAVLVVLHLPPDRPSLLPEIFGRLCGRPVKEAEDKEPVAPGTVYFAPPDYHLLVDRGPELALSADPPVGFSRPAIDVLFETAAEVYGGLLAAVVLTGASDDGAAGLAAVARAGGACVVQDPDTAEVATMPAAALARVPGAERLPLPAIARRLAAWAGEADR